MKDGNKSCDASEPPQNVDASRCCEMGVLLLHHILCI
jgi:hypothetical protein